MFYNSDIILHMDNKKLLQLINESKYIGNRLGDIVLNYPCLSPLHNKTCYLPQKQKFPNSIAIKYTNLYNGNKSLGLKISDSENTDDNLIILKNLCDELNVEKPDDDSLIATIRLGDMIERNKEKRNGIELAKIGGTFWTPNGGTRHILSAEEIINEAKNKNLNEIILVGSKAIGCGNLSVEYFKNIISIIIENGYNCSWFYSFSPDEDFVFISYAKHILTGPGGFCLVAKAISNFRYNNNIKIKPIICDKKKY